MVLLALLRSIKFVCRILFVVLTDWWNQANIHGTFRPCN
jgi:hypothetical protein